MLDGVLRTGAQTPPSPRDDFASACQGPAPYFVVSCFARAGHSPPDAPAVVAFHDTLDDNPSQHVVLARASEVGAVYGLAYDDRRDLVYAGAYHKRLATVGPARTGGIYRIDATGGVTILARLDGGPDVHRMNEREDELAGQWVGKLGLGDLDLDDTGETLFAVNLADRRIYAIRTADGSVLTSFPNGASQTPWASDARPFGLGYRDGWLYHAVVDSHEERGGTPFGHIYRSRSNGTEMAEILSFALDDPIAQWPAWGWDALAYGVMITDLAFRSNGDMLIGLRNRTGDSRVTIALGTVGGDLLVARRRGDTWQLVTGPEFYRDQAFVHPEPLWGGLAIHPTADQVVSTGVAPVTLRSGGAFWFNNVTGRIVGGETIYTSPLDDAQEPTFGKSEGLGDLEALCGPPIPPPPDPTPSPLPIFLPIALAEQPKLVRQFADVVLVLDTSSSMTPPKLAAAKDAARTLIAELSLPQDQVALIGFNRDAMRLAGLTGDRATLEAAIDGIQVQVGTRIDRGLGLAIDELDGPRHRPEKLRAMILLTDGRQTEVVDAPLALARQAQARSVAIFTIGLGGDVDRAFLEQIAGDPARAYFAPSENDLAAIARTIARVIPCRPEDYWSRRCQ